MMAAADFSAVNSGNVNLRRGNRDQLVGDEGRTHSGPGRHLVVHVDAPPSAPVRCVWLPLLPFAPPLPWPRTLRIYGR